MVAPSASKKKFSDRLACDRIQNPPEGEFDYTSLTWFGEKWPEAWIPEERFEDFMRGEEYRNRYHTVFTKRKSVHYRQYDNPQLPIVKSACTYMCCFGPEDMRAFETTDIPRKDSNSAKTFLKTKTILGNSQRRGCRCAFTITAFADRKGQLLLRWLQREHVDRNNKPCHGLDDPTAYAVGAHISPRLSRWSRAYIERCLMAGFTAANIIKEHEQAIITKWRKQNPTEDCEATFQSRDMQLSPKDVRTIREGWRRRQPDFTTKDEVAIKLWVIDHQDDWVIFYQEPIPEMKVPFILVWASPWQIKKLSKQGHNNAVAMDATFKTNEYGVSLPLTFQYGFLLMYFPLHTL